MDSTNKINRPIAMVIGGAVLHTYQDGADAPYPLVIRPNINTCGKWRAIQRSKSCNTIPSEKGKRRKFISNEIPWTTFQLTCVPLDKQNFRKLPNQLQFVQKFREKFTVFVFEIAVQLFLTITAVDKKVYQWPVAITTDITMSWMKWNCYTHYDIIL